MSSSLFSSRLRLLRLRHGLSQKELALLLHYGPSAISNYESGRTEPSLSVLVTLADFFHVSTDHLLGHDVPLPPFLSPDDVSRLILFLSSCSAEEKEVLLRLCMLLQQKKP